MLAFNLPINCIISQFGSSCAFYVEAHRHWVEVGYYFLGETEGVVVVVGTVYEVDQDSTIVGSLKIDLPNKVAQEADLDLELLYYGCS